MLVFVKARSLTSSGVKNNNALPFPAAPLAVLPTLWMYSRGSSGGSN